MSQVEVLNFLQENPNKWFSSTDLKKILKIGLSPVSANLKRLFKQNLILRKNIKLERGNIVFRYKFKKQP